MNLEIPVHGPLQAAIEAGPTGELTFLVTGAGKAFAAAGFGGGSIRFASMRGSPGCSARGLRKAAARQLAEAGCTAHEIMAITGYRTLRR